MPASLDAFCVVQKYWLVSCIESLCFEVGGTGSGLESGNQSDYAVHCAVSDSGYFVSGVNLAGDSCPHETACRGPNYERVDLHPLLSFA